MIKIRIKNADHEIDIRFPISESELFAKLGEIHAVEGTESLTQPDEDFRCVRKADVLPEE